jgi:two-component system cell cycle sensor histidine kinase/response regulator CckA
MIPGQSPLPADANGEVSALIATLHETGQRLEELTAGEVDTVADGDGRAFLLQRAQEQLRHIEAAKQAAILNALPAHIALLDPQGLIISVNEAWRRFARATVFQEPAHGVGLNYLEICDRARGDGASEAHQVGEGIRSVLGGEVKRFSIEYPCHGPGGQRWFLLTVTPLADDHPTGAIVMHLDVTAERQTEESLRESEERFRATFEQSGAGMGHSTLDGRWVRVNQRLCDILGYTHEELLARTFQDITHPDDLDFDLLQRRQLVAGEIQTLSREKRYLHKDGSTVWVDLTVSMLRELSGEPKYFIAVAQDITARKQVEQELFHAQRMEGVGQLAGGIAHDFNNLLTVIGGRSQLALATLPPADPLRRDLELIKKTADRAAALTRQLLVFSRKQSLEPRVVDPNDVVSQAANLLRQVIGEDIELVFVPAGDLGRVRVDPGQLEQVIVNLAVNARDAMPDGGRLTIETSNVALDADYAGRHVGLTPGPYVMVAVSDNGVGMDAATRARIFEPFFTTKGPGKGTGLGLATVYGIVKQSDGHIRVYSEPGVGTVFKIYLVRTDAPPEAEPSRDTTLPRGTETILLVEDDEEVRGLAQEVLETLGYTVLAVTSAADAVLVAERHVGLIDLLLTDVVMPRTGGGELAKAVTAARPETRILFMSGYTDDAIVRHGVLEEGVQLLEKPFTPEALAVKVRTVLNRQP